MNRAILRNKNLALLQEPTSIEKIELFKREGKCGDCEFWRGTCVLDAKGYIEGFFHYKASDPSCCNGKPRMTDTTVPLSFPIRW